MREIKFRAYIKTIHQMIHICGFKYINNFIQIFYTNDDGDYCNQTYKKEDVLLMQFTGLHDKNGVEIYEGDICIVSLSYFKIKNEKATVIFRNGSFQFQYGCEQFFSKPHDSWDEVEVIGNIHERSENNDK